MFYKRHLSPLHRIDQAAFNGGFSPTATGEGDSKEERDGTMGDREGGGEEPPFFLMPSDAYKVGPR